MEKTQTKHEIIEIPDSPVPQEIKTEDSEPELEIVEELPNRIHPKGETMSTRTKYVATTDTDTNLEKETENFLNRIIRDVFYDKDKRDRDK